MEEGRLDPVFLEPAQRRPEWDWCQQRSSEHPDPWPRRGPCLGPLFVPQA